MSRSSSNAYPTKLSEDSQVRSAERLDDGVDPRRIEASSPDEEARVWYQPNGHEGTQHPPESATGTRQSVFSVQNLDDDDVTQQGSLEQDSEEASTGSPPKWHGHTTNPPRGTLQNAFNRMRPRRISPQLATITIGPKTTTTILPPFATRERVMSNSPPAQEDVAAVSDHEQHFSSSMNAFALSRDEGIRSPASQLQNLDKSKSIQRFEDGPSIDENQHSQRSSEVEGFSESEEYANDSFDEEGEKAQEDDRVSKLIQHAEEQIADSSDGSIDRATRILQGGGRKDCTTGLLQTVQPSMQGIEASVRTIQTTLDMSDKNITMDMISRLTEEQTAEDRLSLTVSKSDFHKMSIIGQFNLGFILAFRAHQSTNQEDELFIIDQHASDEKFNFERLQATTTVRNQRLVRPKALDLTAVEEETIIENEDALIKNGFLVEVDQSGDSPVGQRCRLLSLPISREVTFGINDLEELIALLAESPLSSASAHVPRPSKVRRMFAMRACRSSVMIGRTLQKRQMETLVRHMGEIDQPWNCPHGRPTMRHIMGLRAWQGWKEGDGVQGLESDASEEPIDWGRWLDSLATEDAESERDVDENVDEEAGTVERNSAQEEEEDDVEDMEDNDWPINRSTGNGDGSQEAAARLSLGARFSYS